ncbi:hypothetical protein OPKNFCMD_2331 [Methylobacterium crusticola]|uniref:Aerobactin siderophore biosynthesis IucA/IucC-like C-terminal domain-containing protein n=1 Tax=Methylobacterium crusticola TaxID=1697972 RepID=A0ABQ4QXG3_9HYPH|nr:siderophore-iron reductase FhuF [Methylobacterium crusticola]GJD49599.1 hypothetical protein OPKNFCMD_2331 [Methylobacterium crusticola]
MIPEIAALLPPSLATFGTRVAVASGGAGGRPVASLRDRAVFDGVLDGFGAAYPRADRRSLVSLWSQNYLAALVIPCATALLCLDRVLPVALEETGLELDAAHAPARLLLPGAGRAGAPAGGRFALLVAGHLRPFVGLCAAHGGPSPRVLWGNAGVMLDFTLRELVAAAPVLAAPRAEAEALLGWRSGRASPTSPLAQTFRPGSPCDGPCRRVCCTRYRLPGVPSCGALCPVQPPT